jgi:hypothetical protein
MLMNAEFTPPAPLNEGAKMSTMALSGTESSSFCATSVVTLSM